MSELTIGELKAAAERGIHRYLVDLELFVNFDSGTHDRELVERTGVLAAAWFVQAGCDIEWVESSDPALADTYIARRQGNGERKVVMLGHHDTVWAAGTAEERPFTIEEGRAYGPGVSDMKSGVLLGAYAISLLGELGFDDFGELVFVGNPDEEIGSPTSRAIIEREAGDADLVLVLEPGRSPGSVHTTRKGVGMYQLNARGVSAHAGARPEEGRSAVLDLAHKTIALHALTDFDTGTTVNVGVVAGGTRRNVVPAEAELLVDLRAVTAAEAERADAAIREIAAAQDVEGVTIELSGGMNRPPLEKATGTDETLFVARRIVDALGLAFEEATSGGGSDGNFTAPLGVPTLDGLGAVGGGAHALHEWIELDSLADRLTLVAGLIAWGPARGR